MSIAYGRNSILPIVGLASACMLAGVMLSGAIVSHFAESKATAAARQTAAVKARITLLESILRRQADSSVSFSAAPTELAKRPTDVAAAIAEPVAPAVVAQAPVAARPAVTKKDRQIARATTAPSAEIVVAPRPAPTPVLAVDTSAKPVSAEALAAAKASNKIEGIGAEKIGVAKIDATGVVMRSGGKIPVGGRFPSGERLLAVDPTTGQIITDARTVLVFSD